jgi:hypothetical protein
MRKIRTILLIAIVLVTMGVLELPVPCQRAGAAVCGVVADCCPPTCTCHATGSTHACGDHGAAMARGGQCAAEAGSGDGFPNLALPDAQPAGLLTLATELDVVRPVDVPAASGWDLAMFEPRPLPRPPQA